LDINILDEYNKDPRVVTNLTDGVNRTRDDVHMWLAPFTSGGNHNIFVTFDKPCKVALMRIWVSFLSDTFLKHTIMTIICELLFSWYIPRSWFSFFSKQDKVIKSIEVVMSSLHCLVSTQ